MLFIYYLVWNPSGVKDGNKVVAKLGTLSAMDLDVPHEFPEAKRLFLIPVVASIFLVILDQAIKTLRRRLCFAFDQVNHYSSAWSIVELAAAQIPGRTAVSAPFIHVYSSLVYFTFALLPSKIVSPAKMFTQLVLQLQLLLLLLLRTLLRSYICLFLPQGAMCQLCSAPVCLSRSRVFACHLL
jgi:hypothetical protein